MIFNYTPWLNSSFQPNSTKQSKYHMGTSGLQNGRGAASEVLPLRKGGGGEEKILAMLPEGGWAQQLLR